MVKFKNIILVVLATMLVPSMAFSIEKIIDWTSEAGVNIYDAIEDSFLYNSNPSNFPGIIKAYFPTEYDYITCDLDPAKITCDTPYVGYSIDEEMGTYDPDWNDDICPQYQFKPTIYASIVKHHWNQKNKYKKWWNKACEVSNEEELKEALALASGSKRIGGKFWNRRLNIRAVCKDYSDAGIGWGKKPKDPKTGEKVGVSISCRNDANDSNDIIFKPYTDEWWHAHICATELIPIADGNPEGVEPTEDAYQGHSIRVIKKIILKNDIALKSPLVVGKDKIIFVPAQSKKIYSPRVFDIEITGETPAISLTGDKFKGSSILIRKSSSDNDPLTISNLTIKNFEAPLIKYDPINDNYPRNVNVIKNTFKDNADPMLVLTSETMAYSNDRINKVVGNKFYGTPSFIEAHKGLWGAIIYNNSFPQAAPPASPSISIINSSEISFTLAEQVKKLDVANKSYEGCYNGSIKCTKLVFSTTSDLTPVPVAELYYNGTRVGVACSPSKDAPMCTTNLKQSKESIIIWVPYTVNEVLFHRSGFQVLDKFDEPIGNDIGAIIADVLFTAVYKTYADDCTESDYQQRLGVSSKLCSISKCKDPNDKKICLEECGKANACSMLIQSGCKADDIWNGECSDFDVNDPKIFEQNKQAYTEPVCDSGYFYNKITGNCEFKCPAGQIKIIKNGVNSCGSCPEGYVTIDTLACSFNECPEGKVAVVTGGATTCETKEKCNSRSDWVASTNECSCKDPSMTGDDCSCPADKPDFKNGICQAKKEKKSSTSETATKTAPDLCDGEGQEYNGMLDRCTCVDGYFCGDDRDENDDCICEALKEDTCSGYIDSMSGLCVTGDTDKSSKNDNISKRAGGDGCSLSDAPLSPQTAANLAPYLALFIILRLITVRLNWE